MNLLTRDELDNLDVSNTGFIGYVENLGDCDAILAQFQQVGATDISSLVVVARRLILVDENLVDTTTSIGTFTGTGLVELHPRTDNARFTHLGLNVTTAVSGGKARFHYHKITDPR